MKTKKISTALVVFAMALGLFAPALLVAPVSAIPTGLVDTSVIVSSGGGGIPKVMAKWEQDSSQSLEDGDPSHVIQGSQFDPSCNYQATEQIQYCAVITDEEDNGNVQMVSVDVNHPTDSWFCGNQKYEIKLTKETNQLTARTKFLAADGAHLTTFGVKDLQLNYSSSEVEEEINKNTASLWCGYGELYYEQPAGNYRVDVIAIDQNDNPSAKLTNTFLYRPTTCFELDNAGINYGNVSMGSMKVIAGNTIFSTNDGKMTIRNLGNTFMKVAALQDDMNFSYITENQNKIWNVFFDGRVGHKRPDGTYIDTLNYEPYGQQLGGTPTNPVSTTLPGYVPHSTDEELDFSIHIRKALSTGAGHGGKLTISSTVLPWTQLSSFDQEYYDADQYTECQFTRP